ncbi:MAG: 2-C-methyl-D-erythritol 2,4-cyclodiphosphate synthase [Gemmatimonadota bacterium]
MRVGIGYDSHRFDRSRSLILGGIEIPGSPGLKGHSDGDAVLHAVTDALLGAAAAGDIGSHFPPGDLQWEGADSALLLGRAVEILRDRALEPSNIDVTVVCEEPKIRPVSRKMRERIASLLGLSPTRVSVKGKTNEGMGWIGAGEGIAVLAVATVSELADQGGADPVT